MDRPEGDALRAGIKSGFKGTMWRADGTKILIRQVLNVVDKDNFLIEKRTRQTAGQEEVAQPTIKARRVQ